MPDRQITIAESDLRLLYAKLNAHEAILRAVIRLLVDSSDDPAIVLEILRSIGMDEGDSMTRRRDDPNPEFAAQGMLDTLSFIAGTFAYLTKSRG